MRDKHQHGIDAVKVFERRYNGYGYLARLERSNGLVIWSATTQDASNRLMTAKLGNGLTIVRDYNSKSGRLANATLKDSAQIPQRKRPTQPPRQSLTYRC